MFVSMHQFIFMQKQNIRKLVLIEFLVYLTRLEKSLFVANDWSGFVNVRCEFDNEYLFVDKNVGRLVVVVAVVVVVVVRFDTNLS
jgi:hypothetical protein